MVDHHPCQSSTHGLARRQFLGGLAAGAGVLSGGIGAFVRPAAAQQLANQQKRVLLIFMFGGVSQLETWDPKPGQPTGGPFRAIPTSVPGIHVGELIPHTARQMHHLSIVRSVDTGDVDHGNAQYIIETGRRRSDPLDYPRLGAVMAKALEDDQNPLPPHIHISTGAGRGNDAAYLGPRYASINLPGGRPPQYSARPKGLDEATDASRQAFRRLADERFTLRRRSAFSDAYTSSYDQALALMEQRDAFDVAKEPQADQTRYGERPFGRHCLLARRLLERGATFVKVSQTNYDSHHENFTAHQQHLGEFDKPFATLIEDLAQRGLLESTLVVVMSEFGRTPNINPYYGRDHWAKGWSVVLGGCGIQPGAVIGKTNDTGMEIADRPVDAAHLFHTYLAAMGLKSSAAFDVEGRHMPMADPASYPIKELLA